MQTQLKRIFVEGAGLIGPSYAALLSDFVGEVIIFEKRQLSECTKTFGKSVNLALGSKGWSLFDHLGYTSEVKEIIMPMKGRMIHDLQDVNKRLTQSYGYYPDGSEQTLDAVSRLGLSLLLINLAKTKHNVKFNFGVGIEKINASNEVDQLVLSNGEIINVGPDDLVIAAGGVNSQIRKSLQEQGKLIGERKMLNYSYVEIEMPAINKQCIVPNKYLHIFPRGGFKQMFAGLPNPDNSVTAAWYAPQTGTNSFNDIYSMGSARFFDKHFPVATQLVPDFIEQFDARKPSQLSEVRMKKTWHYKNFVIVGDAAHAVTPFYGQGMNFSMWLALKLNKLLRTMPTLESALDAFDLFMADANRLADWSQQNFDEMSTTNSPQLQLRKDIEAELEINYPKFASMHTKVCFRDIEYADIEKQMGVADGIFEDVLKLPNVYTNWKTTLFPKIVSMMVPA